MIPDPVRLMKRFEHLRTLGYMAVLGGIFCGPIAELVLISPGLVQSLDLTKILLIAACAGMPTVVILGAALMVSEVIGALDEKPDMRKLGPGILATAGIMAMLIQAVSIVFGSTNPERYFVRIALTTGAGATTIIVLGALERWEKARRRRASCANGT